jgi:hypothetical protein
MAGWNASTLAGPDAGSVTILEGSSFCVSDSDGDIHPRLPHGLFVRDTRILSTWLTRINGHPVEPLAVESDLPYRTVLLGRLRTQDERASESSLVIERRRTVMIEALACGTPVITTPRGSAPEIVDDGVTGYLCRSRAALIAATARVVEISREACRRVTEGRLSAERMAADYASLFSEARAAVPVGAR